MKGIYQRSDLSLTDNELANLVRLGRLRRIYHGWYADELAPPDAVRALANGVRLGCLTGAAHHGTWIPPGRETHWVIRSPDAWPPPFAGVQVHRSKQTTRPDGVVYPLAACLRHVIDNHDADTALMVLESARELGLLGGAEISSIIDASTLRRQRSLTLMRYGAASGGETLVRLFFQRNHVRVRTQVRIAGVGTVDLLVGDSLIIEVDGREYHATASQFEYDRQRDLAAKALGFTTIRLSYRQIFGDWAETQRMLGQIVRDRHHRRSADTTAIICWIDAA